MAKGSVRKKGSKWYYRFYVEDESGKLVQREFAGTASKSETEAMLRKAMEDYEAKKFVAKSENVTVGQMLDMWVEEELKPGSLSNGTVSAYQGTVGRIKQFPIGERKLKTVTPEHLQSFLDLLSFGGMDASGKEVKPITSAKAICASSRRCCRVRSGSRYSPSGFSATIPCSMWSCGRSRRVTNCSRGRQQRRAGCSHHHLRAVCSSDGLAQKEEQSGAAPHSDRLLHRASDRRGMCADLVRH